MTMFNPDLWRQPDWLDKAAADAARSIHPYNTTLAKVAQEVIVTHMRAALALQRVEVVQGDDLPPEFGDPEVPWNSLP